MAYVLNLAPHSPSLHASGSDAHVRTCSSISGGTVQHHRLRSISTSSLSSVGSYFLPSPRRQHEVSSTPPRSASSINFNKLRERCSASITTSRRSSTTSAFGNRIPSDSVGPADARELRLVDVAERENDDGEPSRKSEDFTSIPEEVSDTGDDIDDSESTLHFATVPPISEAICPSRRSQQAEQPVFRRWTSKLRRKRKQGPPVVSARLERWSLDDFDHASTALTPPRRSTHQKSESQNSSVRFVTAMRSATATLASVSVAAVSRHSGRWRRGGQRSSIVSDRDPRPSVDSARSVIDGAAKQRSRKRREKIEELIRTEESYVADIKALSNAYFTIFGHHATSTSFARRSAQKTITDILHLHDDLLGQLHRVVPFAEYDQSTARAPDTAHNRSHTRWHSVDVVPQRATPTRGVLETIRQGRRSLNISRSSEEDPAVSRCNPKIVAAVTKVFMEHINRFVAYEEYGANYELVQRDIDETQQATVSWSDYDRAIEALSAHINPVQSRQANRKKAMTVKDLLIKPIQRVPRYELLFSDLCKLTPVCDDPDTHAAIHDLCVRLNDICQCVNTAKENPDRARMLKITSLIGDRLSFSSQVPRSVFLQLLGQVALCGCLFVAHRARERVKGQYVICMLFESTLLLACVEEDQPKYSILVGIALANATIEETDNLKGLQCHTAPHSWKVVFEHSARMYELVFVACSAVEAEVWRSHILGGIERQAQAVANGKANVFDLQSPMTSEMKSIGKAFGKPGSFVRRMSVHRAATVGPTTDLNQVIIKNTQAAKDFQQDPNWQTSLQIPRSQSVQTPSHVQTLAPRRAERHRLEAVLADVWTKDLLPYPGMVRRSDPIRASASHVIRKFSMASITSNFSASKRTASYTSIASSARKEDMPPPASRASRRDSRATHPARPPLVNFHNAPDAFLPADFELHDPVARKKRSALRTFTMTMERPFSPLLGNDSKPSSLRRAQSVKDIVPDARAAPAPSPTAPHVWEQQPKKPEIPAYSVVQERAKTPATLQVPGESKATRKQASEKSPRKSKSRMLLKLFG